MTSRRLLPALGLLILLGLSVWWLLPPAPEPATAGISPAEAWDARREKNPSAQPSRAAVIDYEAPSSRAAELNALQSNITGDLNLINDLFTNWRLNFPRVGHPFGENAEITAALIGDNPLRLPLIPRDHPAINAAGELTDRWGTPFRFHALASDRMEVRSAGPDKIFGTLDDAVLTPPGGNPPL